MLQNKVALVTGAASGIGRATAVAFAKAGARAVAVADVNTEGLEETAAMVRALGAEALAIRTDVSRAEDVERMVADTVAAFRRLDCAFINAGIEGATAPTAEITRMDWDRTLATNLTGVWLCMKAELPLLLAADGGAIVNCASVAGLVGFQGAAAYVASKHGVVGLTKATALDYAPTSIRINAVCPGVIQTPMIDRVLERDPAMEAALTAMEPAGRLGRADEIADAVIWLCSDAASFVTGQAIAIDGGFVAR
ncbi:MAG TPA: glucose 1-dehydrogenase [Thermomicrobiales bacterium]|nr:glucose 1-dehydrogenase [Thermomicrobiales bacterium]